MTGRPSSFTQAIADTICERMAEGESLRLICRDDAMPARSSVFRWLRENEAFRDQYAQAREDLFETWGEDVYETALTAAPEDTARARLLVDTRKWQLSKMAPKKYGEKVEHEHGGVGGGPIGIAVSFIRPNKD